MEIGEHSPGQGKPAKLPVALCERRIHTPTRMVGVWCERGAYGQDGGEACNLYVSSHTVAVPARVWESYEWS